MTYEGWEAITHRVREHREGAGLPVRSAERKRADMDRLIAEVRAHRLTEIRQKNRSPERASEP
jgi:hypothetical protein